MPEYFYIVMLYDKLCIAGSYKTKEDAEKDLPIFPKGSIAFPSDSPSVGDRAVVNRARELMYSPKEGAEKENEH